MDEGGEVGVGGVSAGWENDSASPDNLLSKVGDEHR